jgi:hypothetical protein
MPRPTFCWPGYFNTGKYDKARNAFERTLALDLSPRRPEHHNLGALALPLGELETPSRSSKLRGSRPRCLIPLSIRATYLVMALPADSLTPTRLR